MKKSIIIFALIFFVIGANVIAQDSVMVSTSEKESRDFRRVEFGVRFMPTISAFDMETSNGGVIKGEATLGYGIGAFLGFNISNHIGISVEMIYSTLSQKYKDEELNREIKVRYVNFPLLLSLNTGKSNPVNLKIEAGPQIGYNLGADFSSSGDETSDTITTVFTTKKNDFGFAYGAGLEFALNQEKTTRLDIGYRGVYGLVNISNNSEPAEDEQFILERAKIRTNALYIGFTLLF